MQGIGGTGLYGKERTLAAALRADRQTLKNAPLGPRQRREHEKRVAETQAGLKSVRAEIRAAKAKARIDAGIGDTRTLLHHEFPD